MVYAKGSIITSDVDLAKKFGKVKFQEVGNITVAANDPTEPPIPDPIPIGIPMGVGVRENLPKTAETLQTPAIPSEPQTVVEKSITSTNSTIPDKEDEVIKGDPHPKYGENLTHKFPKAQVSQLQVFHDGEKFRVVDPGTGKAISRKLSTEEKVADFLEDF
jgi:hypothetical protein